MVIIKSFQVGNGDMFYINHGNDNFTIIDCNLPEENEVCILEEILKESLNSNLRFISTHPDKDYIFGLKKLFSKIPISNFYRVHNGISKYEDDEDFQKYYEQRDKENYSFSIERGLKNTWLNESDEDRDGSGLSFLWPNLNNSTFIEELNKVNDVSSDISPNNISPIIRYGLQDSCNVLWMGDLETNFLDKIKNDVYWSSIDILFAPHHGRASGKVPKDILDKLNPKIIVIGEGPSEYLEYYNSYPHICQNTAGTLMFDCYSQNVDVYCTNEDYTIDFLVNKHKRNNNNYFEEFFYKGTLKI